MDRQTEVRLPRPR